MILTYHDESVVGVTLEVSELVADYVASLCTCISAVRLDPHPGHIIREGERVCVQVRLVAALSTQSGGSALRAALTWEVGVICK